MTTSELLTTLCEPAGVAGLEDRAVEIARGLLAPLGPCETSPLGSLVCQVRPAAPDKPHLMLTAHIDSIGMAVSYIDEKGFLRVGNCGGVDRSMVLASQVLVHTAQGDLEGVVCTVPPHLNVDDSKLPKMEELSLDIGMDGQAAKKAVMLGDRVTFRGESRELPGGRVCAPALDDRAGCAAVILAAQKLAAQALGCGLTVVLSVMEEAGGQGAQSAARMIHPTHAIAVDVSFAHTPDSPRAKCGLMGKGPMIGIAPVLDNGMFEGMLDAAKRHAIPWQAEVMSPGTGTDIDGIIVCGAGVRGALLSIPQFNMHTPVEVVTVSDVEAVAELITCYVKHEFGGER